ncbi:MAG TPA: SRPBCC family protein [Solirubrobacteraceae bacterium]|jgi:uncharacterized protein YndB with AHSA1/START domain|nr:SRPBCC family protein [Solirubrobacteraceae bacterium]
MSTVTASIEIAAAPDRVWEVAMNPQRLSDWVTIHRRLRDSDDGPARVGFCMDQQIHLRGVHLDVHWRLVQCDWAELAVWEGHGPARSRARTEYRLTETAGGGTRFDYRNDFHAPLGPLGALASRALVGGIPEREARRTLERLKEILESEEGSR